MGAPIRLHGASGLSCRGLTRPVAQAMAAAGFTTVRLGLETADPKSQEALGGKVTLKDFHQALDHLSAAGFERSRVGVYVMVGLPGQTREEVEMGLQQVLAAGARPHLAEYSPVPQSPMFSRARAHSPWHLSEPLFHNPTLLPCAGPDLVGSALAEIKQSLQERLRGR